jgi:hypothetical protein
VASRFGNSYKKSSSIHGVYKSVKTGQTEFYDSTYELRRFVALDASPLVKTWTKKHGIRISYRYKKSKKKYLPDILVEYNDGRKFLEEIKGFVYQPAKFVLKNGVAKLYCHMRRWTYRIIWEDGLEKVQ